MNNLKRTKKYHNNPIKKLKFRYILYNNNLIIFLFMSLKQIQIGGSSYQISMPQVRVKVGNENVMALTTEHSDVNDTEDVVYTLELKHDENTIKATERGLSTNLKVFYDEAQKKLGLSGANNQLIEDSSVDVSQLFGKLGLLKNSAYDETTGVLTLTFETTEGDNSVQVNLGKLLDVNDVAVKSDSTKYLTFELSNPEQETEQAVVGVKVAQVENATENATGLVDAYEVKTFVDSKEALLTNKIEMAKTELSGLIDRVKQTADTNKTSIEGLQPTQPQEKVSYSVDGTKLSLFGFAPKL